MVKFKITIFVTFLLMIFVNSHSQIRGFDVLMNISKLYKNDVFFINDSPYKTSNKGLSIEYFSSIFPSTKDFLDTLKVNNIMEIGDSINRTILSSISLEKIDLEKISNNNRLKDSLYESKIRSILGYGNEISFNQILDSIFVLNLQDSIHELIIKENIQVFNSQIPEFYIFINKFYVVNNKIIIIHFYKHMSNNFFKFFKGGCIIFDYDKSFNIYNLLAFEESYHR